MRLRTLFALLALSLAAASPSAAQEVQVPLDEDGRVQTADVALARQLGLWVDEYPGFQEARLFRTADSTFVLEVTTLRQGQTSRQRVPLTADQVAALRRDVSARIAERAPRVGMDQQGRYLLLGQTTLAGVGFYGWAVPYILKADDAAAGSLYLLTAGTSFFLPFILTQNQPVSYGMANLSRYGITRGAAHGLLLHNLFFQGGEDRVYVPDPSCDVVDQCYYVDSHDDDRRRAAFALLGSVAEGVVGYAWARDERMSAGTASAVSLGGDAGLLGAFTGATAVALLDDDASRGITAAAILGSAAGFALADGLVKETDFTVGQATLNRLGTIAGGLAGASLGVATESEKVALAGGALGALAGFGITYGALAPQAKDRRGEEGSALRVQITPSALLSAALSQKRGRPSPSLPLLNVEYRLGAN
jgi:hypothetical protein